MLGPNEVKEIMKSIKDMPKYLDKIQDQLQKADKKLKIDSNADLSDEFFMAGLLMYKAFPGEVCVNDCGTIRQMKRAPIDHIRTVVIFSCEAVLQDEILKGVFNPQSSSFGILIHAVAVLEQSGFDVDGMVNSIMEEKGDDPLLDDTESWSVL